MHDEPVTPCIQAKWDIFRKSNVRRHIRLRRARNAAAEAPCIVRNEDFEWFEKQANIYRCVAELSVNADVEKRVLRQWRNGKSTMSQRHKRQMLEHVTDDSDYCYPVLLWCFVWFWSLLEMFRLNNNDNNDRITESAGHRTGAGDRKTHRCHQRGQQRNHLPVSESVRGSVEGKCSLILRHFSAQVVCHCCHLHLLLISKPVALC